MAVGVAPSRFAAEYAWQYDTGTENPTSLLRCLSWGQVAGALTYGIYGNNGVRIGTANPADSASYKIPVSLPNSVPGQIDQFYITAETFTDGSLTESVPSPTVTVNTPLPELAKADNATLHAVTQDDDILYFNKGQSPRVTVNWAGFFDEEPAMSGFAFIQGGADVLNLNRNRWVTGLRVDNLATDVILELYAGFTNGALLRRRIKLVVQDYGR